MEKRVIFIKILIEILIVALLSVGGAYLVFGVLESNNTDETVDTDQQRVMDSWKELDERYSELGEKANNAVDSIDKGYKRVAATKLYPATFSDKSGNSLTYYACITEFYDPNQLEEAEKTFDCKVLPETIIDSVINPDMAESSTPCKVKDYNAIVYNFDGRAYLCAVISPEFSFVIDYDPEVLPYKEVLKTAESIPGI